MTSKVDFRAVGEAEARLELAGTLSEQDPGPALTEVFSRLDRMMRREKRRRVVVDLRELRFMNASSFRHLASWIKQNDAHPEGRYEVHFVITPKHVWQTTSVHALRCFSNQAITVETASP